VGDAVQATARRAGGRAEATWGRAALGRRRRSRAARVPRQTALFPALRGALCTAPPAPPRSCSVAARATARAR